MPEIKIVTVGKTRGGALLEAIEEYVQRLQGKVSVSFHTVRDDSKLLEAVQREKGPIALDEHGHKLSSKKFADYLFQHLEAQRGLTFLIGGANGLPEALPSSLPRLSLSALTFTHQMVRLVLVEQIYRAFEIRKGSPYHK